MRILLLDNAIDSFEWSLKHLDHFLEIDSNFEKPDTSTTYLKQAIISLNTALELFFKAKISDINPLFIYEHVSTDNLPVKIINYYSKMQKKEINEPLYNYMIENSEIHTIDYTWCIDLYCELYSVPKGDKENFIALNNIRNKLIHLGINNQSEYYILAGQIANILFFIQNKILKDLDYNKKHIEQVSCDILNIEFTLSSLEDKIWAEANLDKIKNICSQMETLFKSKEIVKYMEEKNVKADFGLTLDIQFSYASISMQKDGQEYIVVSIYSSPQKDSILVSDSENANGPVYAVITLSETANLPSKFYLAKSDTGIEVPNFCEQGEFWKTKPHKDKFDYVQYGKIQLTEMLKKIINMMSFE